MKKITMIAALCALPLVMTGCSVSSTPDSGQGTASTDVKASDLTIGWLSNDESFPFTAAVTRGALAEAEALGVNLVVTDAQSKTDKQSADLQDLIAQHVNGLIILPVDATVGQTLTDKAVSANVPILAAQSQIGDAATRDLKDVYPGLVGLVIQDEELAGAQAAELVKELLPEGGEIAIIEGAPGYSENELRTVLFKKALDESDVNYTIVATQPGNWAPDVAQDACANILASNPNVSLFYTLYDDMSMGCAEAIRSAQSSAITVGVGGGKAAIAAISSGDSPFKGTVCFQPESMGALAVRTLVEQLTGEKTYDAEFVAYDTFGVSAENIDDCAPQF